MVHAHPTGGLGSWHSATELRPPGAPILHRPGRCYFPSLSDLLSGCRPSSLRVCLVYAGQVVDATHEDVRAERGLDACLRELTGHRLGHLGVADVATAGTV